jgi:L-asparaginase II
MLKITPAPPLNVNSTDQLLTSHVQQQPNIIMGDITSNNMPNVLHNEIVSPHSNENTSRKSEDTIHTHRGGIIENVFRIHAAVTSSTGQLLYELGNPSRMVLARSAAKPAQTLAILQTGAAAKYNFSDADIALMSASHSSEPRHIARSQEILRTIGAKEEDLACGGHPALSAAVNRAWIKDDYFPSAICSNCSGKHAGMIAGALCLDAPIRGYHEPDHSMQLRVKMAMEDVCGLEGNDILWAIDGCNLPTPAMPLRNMALIYARLAGAQQGIIKDDGSNEAYLRRIHDAMARYPEMVGGEGRFCTRLMEAYNGLLVGKLGADGCYGVAVRAEANSDGDEAIGIAVKVEDGNIDILYSAVMEILETLDIGTTEMRHKLESFYRPAIINTVGVVTGGVKHNFKVRKVEEQRV